MLASLPHPGIPLLQKLRTSCNTILCLDGGRISATGIVSGSSFVVTPLDKADLRFGSSGAAGEVRAAAQRAACSALLLPCTDV